jgi:hypothetical protein
VKTFSILDREQVCEEVTPSQLLMSDCRELSLKRRSQSQSAEDSFLLNKGLNAIQMKIDI